MKIPKIFGLPPPSIQLPTPVGRNLAPVNMIKYPIIHKYIIYRVSYLSGGAGFLLSTVFLMTILVVFFCGAKTPLFCHSSQHIFLGGSLWHGWKVMRCCRFSKGRISDQNDIVTSMFLSSKFIQYPHTGVLISCVYYCIFI